jgi:hypothetical protein
VTDEQWQRIVENRLNALETNDAVNAVQYQNILERLQKIEGALSKVSWLVIAVIVGGVINFMMNGGFSVPTP